MHGASVLLALWAMALASFPACAWQGRVTWVVDGDTLHVAPLGGGAARRVRLQGLDAPEICQDWGGEARLALATRVLHRRVQVLEQGEDSYGRLLARIRVEGEDVGAWLVAQGHAWAYRTSGYAALENRARQQRLGLFAAAAPLRPQDFRRRFASCYPPR